MRWSASRDWKEFLNVKREKQKLQEHPKSETGKKKLFCWKNSAPSMRTYGLLRRYETAGFNLAPSIRVLAVETPARPGVPSDF